MPVRVRPSAPSLPLVGLVGAVLAGGRSRRLGTDKALLVPASPPHGESLAREGTAREGLATSETLVQRAAGKLAGVCSTVVIADRGRDTCPPWPSLSDGPGQGPAAGILGAAAHYPGQGLLVLACDLPRVPRGLLHRLAELVNPSKQRPPGEPGTPAGTRAGRSEEAQREAFDLVVVETRRGLEPLCAAYGPRALEVLRDRVERGRFALHPLASEPTLRVWRIRGAKLERFGEPAETLLNLNRPEDLERLLALEQRER